EARVVQVRGGGGGARPVEGGGGWVAGSWRVRSSVVTLEPLLALPIAGVYGPWGATFRPTPQVNRLPLASAALSALAGLEQILKRSGIALRCCKCWPDRWGCSHPGCAMANSPMSCSRWLRPSL